MTQRLTAIVIVTLCSIAILTPAATAQENNNPPAGFKALFNGKNLDGWWGEKTTDPRSYMSLSDDKLAERMEASRADVNKHWRVENGELVNDGHGLYLTTNAFYGDFELLVDYKTVAKADSGIYLRGIPQVQIWDFTEAGGKWKIGADKGSGGLWNNPADWPGKDPSVLADKPFGEWNRFRIVMVGERVSIWLNGKHIVDHARLVNFYDKKAPPDKRLPVPRTGPIQLQTHGGEIRWRNVFLREIPADEAAAILRNNGLVEQPTDAGFKTIFNGKDFSGWKGPIENYDVIDGAIVCKQGKGGTIYHEDTYSDFAVDFEFQLPPGGNNGLAIRYPGSGDTAYVGMCELQVLDNTADKYAKLDPRQYHGSAYGQWPAHRGYLRPVGEWNFQRVTVVGPRITVELNGTTILDKDISTITEFMAKAEKYKGRDRTEGHFGFAGHSDPVRFRAVRIKKLK